MHQTDPCRRHPYSCLLRTLVFFTVLLLTLRGQVSAPARWRRKSTTFPYSCRYFCKDASRFENCVQTLSQTVAAFSAKVTSVERVVSSLAARVATLETGAPSASNVSGSARSWNMLGQSDGSTGTGSHGPESSDDNRNTRRRLDTFSYPDDESARSAVLLQFQCEQIHAGVSTTRTQHPSESDMTCSRFPLSAP